MAAEYGRPSFRKMYWGQEGGVLTLGTKNLAKEVLEFNVSIIRSGLEYRQRLPMGRVRKPDEIACIAIVLSTDLSAYMYGALIAVDGGFL